MSDKTILDVKCPHCGSYHTDTFGTDEIEFAPDGTGFYSPDMSCFDCHKSFRMWYNFKYEITSSYIRK